jgi:hypothetical protein
MARYLMDRSRRGSTRRATGSSMVLRRGLIQAKRLGGLDPRRANPANPAITETFAVGNAAEVTAPPVRAHGAGGFRAGSGGRSWRAGG